MIKLGNPIKTLVTRRDASSTDTEVDTDLRHLLTQRNSLSDPTLETRRSIRGRKAEVNRTMNLIKEYPEGLRLAILEHDKNISEYEMPITALIEGNSITLPQLNEYFAYPILLGRYPGRLLRGVHLYPQLPQTEDFTTTDPSTQEQVSALLAVTTKLESECYEMIQNNPHDPRLKHLPFGYTPGDKYEPNEDNAATITNSDIIQLILDHPDRANEIADLIIQRRTNDPQLLRDIIEPPATALGTGVL